MRYEKTGEKCEFHKLVLPGCSVRLHHFIGVPGMQTVQHDESKKRPELSSGVDIDLRTTTVLAIPIMVVRSSRTNLIFGKSKAKLYKPLQ